MRSTGFVGKLEFDEATKTNLRSNDFTLAEPELEGSDFWHRIRVNVFDSRLMPLLPVTRTMNVVSKINAAAETLALAARLAKLWSLKWPA